MSSFKTHKMAIQYYDYDEVQPNSPENEQQLDDLLFTQTMNSVEELIQKDKLKSPENVYLMSYARMLSTQNLSSVTKPEESCGFMSTKKLDIDIHEHH